MSTSLDYYRSCAYPKPSRAKNARAKQHRDDAKARREYLRTHPMCSAPNCLRRATEVDHEIAKAMGGTREPELHDEANFAAFCTYHHRQKHGERVA